VQNLYKNFQYFAGFRVNFASADPVVNRLDRRTTRGLSKEELAILTSEINNKVNLVTGPEVQFQLSTFGSYRGVLGFYSNSVKLSGNVSNTDPGFRKEGYFSLPVRDYLPEPRRCGSVPNKDIMLS